MDLRRRARKSLAPVKWGLIGLDRRRGLIQDKDNAIGNLRSAAQEAEGAGGARALVLLKGRRFF
jgi:hypothetical protein